MAKGYIYGEGRAMLETAQFGKASTGTDQMVVTINVTAGEYKEQKLAWFASFTDASFERTVRGLKAAGARCKDDDPTDLVGLGSKDCRLSIELKEVQDAAGVTKRDKDGEPIEVARVAWVDNIGASFKNEMSAAEKGGFRERIMAMARAKKAGGGAAGGATGGSTDSEETPF